VLLNGKIQGTDSLELNDVKINTLVTLTTASIHGLYTLNIATIE
jgi:hypothetical protein